MLVCVCASTRFNFSQTDMRFVTVCIQHPLIIHSSIRRFLLEDTVSQWVSCLGQETQHCKLVLRDLEEYNGSLHQFPNKSLPLENS